jgi:hypothetical protein
VEAPGPRPRPGIGGGRRPAARAHAAAWLAVQAALAAWLTVGPATVRAQDPARGVQFSPGEKSPVSAEVPDLHGGPDTPGG